MNNNEEENNRMAEPKTEPQAPAKKREKNPTYHVLRSTGEDGVWKLLTASPISAASRKAAIVAATKSEADKGGTFLVLPEKEYSPIKRAVEQVMVDKFE